jgi:hypothetical protein
MPDFCFATVATKTLGAAADVMYERRGGTLWLRSLKRKRQPVERYSHGIEPALSLLSVRNCPMGLRGSFRPFANALCFANCRYEEDTTSQRYYVNLSTCYGSTSGPSHGSTKATTQRLFWV